MVKRKTTDSEQYFPYAKWNCIRRVLYRGKVYSFDEFISMMHLAWPKAKKPFNVWKLVDLLDAKWVLG